MEKDLIDEEKQKEYIYNIIIPYIFKFKNITFNYTNLFIT